MAAMVVGGLGAVLVFVLGLRGTRWVVLLARGLVVGAAFVVAVYLAASTELRSDCSDCREYGGRCREPWLAGSFGVFATLLSWAGAALGRGIGHALRHSI